MGYPRLAAEFCCHVDGAIQMASVGRLFLFIYYGANSTVDRILF